jgi:hypothetical protein
MQQAFVEGGCLGIIDRIFGKNCYPSHLNFVLFGNWGHQDWLQINWFAWYPALCPLEKVGLLLSRPCLPLGHQITHTAPLR